MRAACVAARLGRSHAAPVALDHSLGLEAQGGIGTVAPYSALSWHSARSMLCASLVEPAIVRKARIASSAMVDATGSTARVREVILEVARGMAEQGRWQGATLCY